MQTTFIKVPKTLLSEEYSQVQSDLIILYCYLLYRMQTSSKNGYFLSHNERQALATAFSKSADTIDEWIPKLEKAKLITVKHIPGDSGVTVYNAIDGITKNKPFAFYKFQVGLFFADVSARAKLLYTLLSAKVGYSMYKDKEGKQRFYLSADNRDTISRQIGISKSTFNRCISELRKSGLLITKKAVGGSFVYDSGKAVLVNEDIRDFDKLISVNLTSTNRQIYKIRNSVTSDLYINLSNTESKGVNSVVGKKPDITEIRDTTLKFADRFYPNNPDMRDKFIHQINPNKFYDLNNARNWCIDGKPIRYWDKVYDKWLWNSYVDLSANDIRVLNEYRHVISPDIVDMVQTDLSTHKGKVKVCTLSELRKQYDVVNNYLCSIA